MLLTGRHSYQEPLPAIRVPYGRKLKTMAAANNLSGSPPDWHYPIARTTSGAAFDRSPSLYPEPSHAFRRTSRGDEPVQDLPTERGTSHQLEAGSQQHVRPHQLRQKSWHHPYHTTAPPRTVSGPHSAGGTGIGDSDFLRHQYQPQHLQQHHLEARGVDEEERRPSQSSDQTSPRPLSRAPSSSGAALRAYEQAGDLPGGAGSSGSVRFGVASSFIEERKARNFHPSSFPQPSAFKPARTPFSDPTRNRGRASTLSLAQPEVTRQRVTAVGYNSIGSTHPAGTTAAYGHGPGWDDHRTRRDSARSSMTEASSALIATPPFIGNQQQSPLLLAPLSPRMSGGPFTRLAGDHPFPSGRPPTGSRNSRPATPVSPLNMDELSMEDRAAPSGLTMSGPYHRIPQHTSGSGHHGRLRSSSSTMSVAPHRVSRQDPMGWRHEGEEGSSPIILLTGNDPYFPAAAQPSVLTHPPPPPGQLSSPMYPPLPHQQSMMQADQMHSGHLAALERVEYERRLQIQAAMHGVGRGDMFAPGGEPPHRSLGMGPTVASAAPVVAQPPIDRFAYSRRRRRPPYSYSSLIAQAISSSPEGRMTLREIYTWISGNYPGMYPMMGPESQGWQNTVRHNLSLNKSFVKVARTAQDIYDSCSSGVPSQSQAARGKGGWWTLDHSVAASQLGSSFRTASGEGMHDDAVLGGVAGSPNVVIGDASEAVTAATTTTARRLLRQRSYSDSVKRSGSGAPRNSSSAASPSTAPTSRDEYSRYSRDARPSFAAFAPHHHQRDDGAAVRRRSSGLSDPTSASRHDKIGGRHRGAHGPADVSMPEGSVPSVLKPQPRPPSMFAQDEAHDRAMRQSQMQRPRGFTTSAAEPSPLRLYSISAQRQDDTVIGVQPEPSHATGTPLAFADQQSDRPYGGLSARTLSLSAFRHEKGMQRPAHNYPQDAAMAEGRYDDARPSSSSYHPSSGLAMPPIDAKRDVGARLPPQLAPAASSRGSAKYEEDDVDMRVIGEAAESRTPPFRIAGAPTTPRADPSAETTGPLVGDAAQAEDGAESPHGSRRMAISDLLNG